jgi:hypothetical protein
VSDLVGKPWAGLLARGAEERKMLSYVESIYQAFQRLCIPGIDPGDAMYSLITGIGKAHKTDPGPILMFLTAGCRREHIRADNIAFDGTSYAVG